jgi:hypothetical protein
MTFLIWELRKHSMTWNRSKTKDRLYVWLEKLRFLAAFHPSIKIATPRLSLTNKPKQKKNLPNLIWKWNRRHRLMCKQLKDTLTASLRIILPNCSRQNKP